MHLYQSAEEINSLHTAYHLAVYAQGGLKSKAVSSVK